MKKNLAFILCVVVALGCCLSLVGCGGGETITLSTYTEPFEIHTSLQKYYLEVMFNESYQPDAENDEVKGTAELSRPTPIKLSWTDSKNLGNYVVDIAENDNFDNKISVNSTTTSVEVYNLKIATTYYWQVSSGSVKSAVGTFSIAGDGPRNLYIDGITNVRDVGGWMTASGKRTVQGIMFRSARLNRSYAVGKEDSYTEPDVLTPEITALGITQFNALGIRTEIDFRLDARNGYPEATPLESVVDGVRYIALPMKGNGDLGGDNAVQLKKLMEILADKSNYPLVYHCNIGTDRTGMVSYLLGALCGMNDEDLLKDYLFSNFGNIGDLKSPVNKHNAWMGMSDYEGATLVERVENYFKSIGVSEETYNAVRSILTDGLK